MSAFLGPLRFNDDAGAEHFRDWVLATSGHDVRDLEDWEVQSLFDAYEYDARCAEAGR